MRNIYDIIEEQKALAEINIAKYDLDYVTSYLSESSENYYLEEGLGEGIKNAANKVVEIIKKIINKIKEMFRKVINWLTGKKDTKAKLNKEIQDINNGKASSDNTEEKDDGNDEEDWKNLSREEILRRRKLRNAQKKREKNAGKPITISAETPAEKKAKAQAKIDQEKARRTASKNAYKMLDDIEAVMKACKGQVKMQTFMKLEDYKGLNLRFFRTLDPAEREIIKGTEFEIIRGRIINDTFKRAQHADERTIAGYIRNELFGDSHNEIEGYISVFADKVMVYLDNGQGVIDDLKSYEKSAIDSLNKLMVHAERAKDDKAIRSISSLSSMVGEYASNMLSAITKSKNIADAIAKKAVEMYRNQIRGGDLPKEQAK